MWKSFRLRPILKSVLVLVFAHGALTAVADSGIVDGSAYCSAYDYAGSVAFTVNYDNSTNVIENFPLYVKIRENAPLGFRYSDLKNGMRDLRFFDSRGKVLNYETVTWDPTGESVFWVLLPQLSKGATVTMCWNLRDGCTLPDNASTNVWKDYVGVWHMDEEITSETAAETASADATGHGLDAQPKKGSAGNVSVMTSTAGVFGNARVNDTTDRKGNLLAVTNLNRQLDVGGIFTLSLWVKFDNYSTLDNTYPHIVSRRRTKDDTTGYQIHLGNRYNRSSVTVYGSNTNATKGFSTKVVDVSSIKDVPNFTHLAFVFSNAVANVYADGNLRGTNGAINTVSDNGGGLGFGNNLNGTEQSLWGKYDEIRLYKGVKSAAWIAAENELGTNTAFYSAGTVTNDSAAVLKNEWKSAPAISKTTWEEGTYPTAEDFTFEPAHGTKDDTTVIFYNRATGQEVGRGDGWDYGTAIPRTAGDYRVVFQVAETNGWGALEQTLEFRIVSGGGKHDFGINVDRIMLFNDDYSITGGEVEWQSYGDTNVTETRPYWQHLDGNGDDATTPFSPEEVDDWSALIRFNLGGGTRHVYRYRDDERWLWFLDGVRIGNTFNNGAYASEYGDEGLNADQNYLPWNYDSQRVVGYTEEPVDGYHRYVGQAAMQNKIGAEIVSEPYTNGIGTIYFDALNGWADNLYDEDGNPCYKLKVQIATETKTDLYGHTHLPLTTYASTSPDDGESAYDPYYYNNWQDVPMHVLRFDDGVCTDLGEWSELTLDIADGGSTSHFYRVYVPVANAPSNACFRIRRTAIDPFYDLNPDGDAFILIDNIICSPPTAQVKLEPQGEWFSAKTGKQVIGREGAFDPAFPSVTDTAVYGRAKATVNGQAVPAGVVSSATMHYRWHYLEQKTTEWKVADLDPSTFRTWQPLELPPYQGDIDFWFDLNQRGNYYEYADYSGTGLGLAGKYSEEVPSVTNRQSGVDWFVRTREGKSDTAEMKIVVKGMAQPIDMFLTEDGLWRGYYSTSNMVGDVFSWRIEPRNRQTSGAAAWNWNTNFWYVTDWTASASKLQTFPAAGRMSEGDTNSWSRLPCKKDTGYLMFQVDESSLGVTVIRADYQNFNDWNDAKGNYFVGSFVDPSGKKGTSANVRTFDDKFGWAEDTMATNSDWTLHFNDETIGKNGYVGYKTFVTNNVYKKAWLLGKSQWVYGKYREEASHVALQMAGSGEGYAEFSDDTMLGENWPRGIGSVSFKARIAQTISPEYAAFYDGGSPKGMTNYTFMARTCFDQQANEGFSGNAALSLFAYFRSGKGGYEARWEQVKGEVESSPYFGTEVLAPATSGQRLVISRWNWSGNSYVETELVATTNSVQAGWQFNMPTMSSSAATNNLMPFLISAYHTKNATYVTAAVRVSAKKGDKTGVGPRDSVDGSHWYFVTYKDEDPVKQRFTGGTYGVLSSNCEGMFVTPQYRMSPEWPSSVVKKEDVTSKGDYTEGELHSAKGFISCVDDLVDDWWTVSWEDPGRMNAFFDSELLDEANYGLAFVPPYQTVDVYTKPHGQSGGWSRLGWIDLTGFGTPGTEPDYDQPFYYPNDCDVRLQTGGGLDDYPIDVAINDVVISQWRGDDDWMTKDSESESKQAQYGRTNIVFTTGWVTNGAVRLSAKRTEAGLASSVRSPLFDGLSGCGEGLGMIGFTYREPLKNVRLKVQIVTNYTWQSGTSLKTMSQTVKEGTTGNGSWLTITNLDYAALMAGYDAKTKLGSWRTGSELGLHGARGMMRIVVDDTLVQEIADETDEDKFGEIDIVEVVCKNEPALDTGCWWGWNMLTLGDALDSQHRMFLPDYSLDLSQADVGESLALNNSVTENVDPQELTDDRVTRHMPFLQSPTFTNSVIGQISFKARKYDLSDHSPAAKVVVYGAASDPDNLPKDEQWTYVAEFPITNTLYETFTCKTDAQNFYALRLGIVGVKGTIDQPAETDPNPQRVLIDEVSVSEAVRAMLSFRNVGAFRSHLDDNTYVQGVTTKDEQPLCDENWGVQAEVFATMLGDEIYKGYTPRVKLHWFVGKEPWGYENWKKIETGSAYLAQTEGSNYVYRSSYKDAPKAVMPAQTEAGTVVQYTLEVEYKTINSTKKGAEPVLATNWLDSASWTVPEWYAPVDYNSDPEYGAGKTFAAFNILDTVAPGWAWLNEVNVFGTKSDTGANSDEQFQYVEVCVPLEADLTGWRLRMLEAGVYNDTVTTNWIAKFGKTIWDQASGTKATPTKYNKTFRCLGNWVKRDELEESEQYRNGSLDGIWQFSEYTSTFRNRDGVDCVYDIEQPFGIQLVRPSGIIESSIVVVGTNRWGRMPGYREYDPTNVVARLNQLVPGSKFFYAAEDCRGTFRSGSVTSGQGESASVWTNSWACSPGYINTNWGGKVEQKIEPDHPTPHGDSIIIYTTVDQSGGPIRQWVGSKGSSQTNSTEMIILKRGSARGTNIVYQVDPWYEISSITTNGAAFWPYVPRVREYEATVGKGASNGFTVVAKAGVDSDLRDKYGLTEDNPFTPAVMDWLIGGKDAYGREFVNNGEIALADYANIRGEIVTNLTLTQMYCLDMDPTASNLLFQAGMVKAWPVVEGVDPEASVTNGYQGTAGLTNTRMRVFMMITNRNETVAAGYDRAWSPYILRGLNPGSTSWDYESGGVIAQSWTGATFKVTGILANGLTREDNYDNWIPLRWFVFHEDSFFQPGNPEGHDPYTTDIEIVDPHSISSPGAAAGWYEWCREHGYTPIFNRWAIDLRMKPVEVEVLKQENFFE